MTDVIERVKRLIKLYQEGLLGGERMPEDSNPNLDMSSEENLIYFTLPMALNYQRNSYKLWEAALVTWKDQNTHDVFNLKIASSMDINFLRSKLVKYKVALQPNKQPVIWQKLCNSINIYGKGSLKNFLNELGFDVLKIKNFILKHKKDFPYLSGTKILNYWLYVLTQYTSFKFKNRQEISIAPDTHVLQASLKLGVITKQDLERNDMREFVSAKWKSILECSGIEPIDVHTPFWLWSRNGFKVEI